MEYVKSKIRDVYDFPKAGVIFRDLTTTQRVDILNRTAQRSYKIAQRHYRQLRTQYKVIEFDTLLQRRRTESLKSRIDQRRLKRELLVAGINAAASALGREPFVLGRDEAYIGVLIDDLVYLHILKSGHRHKRVYLDIKRKR